MADFTNYQTLAQSIPEHNTGGTWERIKCQTDVDFKVTGNITEHDVFGNVQFTANVSETGEYYDIAITDRSQLKTVDMEQGNEVGISDHLVTDQQIADVIERIQHNLVMEELE